MSIRAVRNNNPGNINARDGSGHTIPWQGLMPRAQMTPEQAAEPRFAVFTSPEYGFRAICKLLMNYETIYGLHTVRDAITRWAPPSENATQNYINHVAHDLGVTPDQIVSLHSKRVLVALARSISTMEAGGWYFNDAQIAKGADLAGAQTP